jgi:hypothetical protein
VAAGRQKWARHYPERKEPQVTGDSTIKDETIKSDLDPERLKMSNTTYLHFKNWVEAMQDDEPEHCNNTPDLGAA